MPLFNGFDEIDSEKAALCLRRVANETEVRANKGDLQIHDWWGQSPGLFPIATRDFSGAKQARLLEKASKMLQS